MVFYRKYRPQTIEELDSEFVRNALTTVLSGKSIPHAFLFTGPKGLGKTSTARIVAKYVNCTGKGKKPCNTCDQCLSITNGTNMDVLEIDGASNRGIDEMRDLREKIRLLPVSASQKVYIIDEVHMLTTEAFNALLKTLEEPPSHAMFILCTTELHKVPETILSRCFQIQFKRASEQDLVFSFERILAGEKVSTENDALHLIASFADGSFRDGAKILEEIVVASQGKKITKELVESLYHVSSISQEIIALLESLLAKDSKQALAVISHIVDLEIDMRYFTQQILLKLHMLLLEQAGIAEKTTNIVIDIATIQKLVTIFSTAYADMKYAVLPQLPLEIAVVLWSGNGSESRVIHSTSSGQANQESRIKNENNEEENPVKTPVKEKQSVSNKTIDTNSEKDKVFLQQLLDRIKGDNFMLAGVLRSCKIHVDEEALTIIVPSPFHKDKLSEQKAFAVLEKATENIASKRLMVQIMLK